MVLQDSSRFHELHSSRDLPPAIITICDEDGKLADPGQNWNATDSITDPSLPAKRLIWGAVGGEYYVLHYERGGIATPITSWSRLSSTMTQNRRSFGAPSVVRSKITWRLSTHCKAANWMTVSESRSFGRSRGRSQIMRSCGYRWIADGGESLMNPEVPPEIQTG